MDSTLHELVLHAAAHHAYRHAVCFHSYERLPEYYTYNKLVTLAKELANFLKFHCGERCKIGLYCQPGVNLPSWILGILQVPATYCPIDPSAPSHLTSTLMERCGLKFMLVEKVKAETFKLLFTKWREQDSSAVQHLDVTLFEMQEAPSLVLGDDIENHRNIQVNENHKLHIASAPKCTEKMCREYVDINKGHCLAYVLHTSGTTGRPKIVNVPHQCIVPNIHHLRSAFHITPDDLLFLASPLTFDPSIIELFLALSTGACLLILPDPIKMMPSKLCDLLFHQHKVTVLQVTPTFLRRFGSNAIRSTVLSKETSLRVLALGGEPFPAINVIRSWKELGNKTQLFNLYGITEVSSWATYYEIPEEMLSSDPGEASVPLGIPLQGTCVEVQNEEGFTIEEGEGQILLGGRERICFLDDEVTLPCSTLRRTGDWVTVKDGNMFFLGRKDNQIKRHGKRLNTEYIQQVVESLPQVESCAVLWFEARQIIVFIIPRGSAEKKMLWKELQTHLLSYAIPDDIVIIQSLPFTRHGKVDVSKLNAIYLDCLRKKNMTRLIQGEEDLWDCLQCIWKTVLGLPEDSPAVAEDSVFLLSGGDSLMAIRFHEEVENLVGKPVPALVEAILSQTILDIYRQVSRVVNQYEVQNTDETRREIANSDNSGSIYPGKRKNLTQTGFEKDMQSVISLRRGNQLYVSPSLSSELAAQLHQMSHGSNQELAEVLHLEWPNCPLKKVKNTQYQSSSVMQTTAPVNTSGIHPCTQGLSLRIRWKSDTGKCVDASPLLVISTDRASPVTAYIGSHSHRMQALDISSGEVLWERVLGDRIESSAAMSKCGNFVLVGSYDGSLYALNRINGETYWVFTTGNAVKSSPAVDPLSGLVFVGSHDHHLYALDIALKQCIWKSHCGGGAVFSSPCVSTKPYHLYAATLGGIIMAVNPTTGTSIWTYDCGKPVFSSPRCNQNHVFVGCVNEKFYCLTHDGEKLWHISTSGPIFSSPCLSNLSKQIVFGSHDGFIYCCNTEGVLLWKYKTSSRVYSTPFVFPYPHTENTELLAVASTDGLVWILDTETGLLNCEYKLEGEVFSSPIAWGRNVVIGCRNDYVYCLEIISNAAAE
ncbi:beta-alanine-activating enzyme isoform 2-T2 [Discoglossus pictus]